jgi:hypothetical protein
MRTVIAITAAVALCSCATPYQSKGVRGGYSDFKMGQGRYSIIVDGNGFTSQATLMEYFHRRAMELCGGSYDANTSTSTSTTLTQINGQYGTQNRHSVSGTVVCDDKR